MQPLKKQWAELLEYSVGLAAGLVMTFCALALLIVVGIVTVVSKILVFIK
jgi:hypothetical protein